MPPTISQRPLSSSGFAPALRLTPRPSRLLRGWWCALHAVLVVAALLVGWPWHFKAFAVALAAGHGAWRWPRCGAVTLLVAADGACRVPDWGPEVLTLTARTRMTPFVLDLRLTGGPGPRRLLLLADQLGRDDWARLSAILRRASVK